MNIKKFTLILFLIINSSVKSVELEGIASIVSGLITFAVRSYTKPFSYIDLNGRTINLSEKVYFTKGERLRNAIIVGIITFIVVKNLYDKNKKHKENLDHPQPSAPEPPSNFILQQPKPSAPPGGPDLYT